MTEDLRSTPLESVHEALGATFTDFAGWRMPVRYSSDLAEHRAVREQAGIFDLSHMGEIELRGAQAGEALDHALAGKVSVMTVGRAKYSLVLAPDGGVLDDVIVYRLAEDRYVVVANASNAPVVAHELVERSAGFDVTVTDLSTEIALIAVQGPTSADIVTRALVAADSGIGIQDVADLGYYRILQGTFEGEELWLARTGYTGEDGFELYCANADAETLWNALLATAEQLGTEDAPVQPAGLAARDSLRLEAGMPLYGHELSTEITPVEAGLGKLVEVALRKKDEAGTRTVGHDALAAMLRSTPERTLIGLEGLGRKPIRAGYTVLSGERTIGEVTSGLPSPTLGKPVAMALVATDALDEIAAGTVSVQDARGRGVEVARTAMPFYTRG